MSVECLNSSLERKGVVAHAFGISGVAAVGAAGYFGIVYLQKRKSNRIVQIAKDLLTDNRHKIVKLVGEFEVPTSRSKFAVTQFQEDTPIGKRDALVIVIMLEGAYGAGIAQIKAVQVRKLPLLSVTPYSSLLLARGNALYRKPSEEPLAPTK
jgi:hypothetical protein